MDGVEITVRRGEPIRVRRLTGEIRDVRYDGPSDISVEDAHLVRVRFSRAKFNSFRASRAVFEECDFANAKLDSKFHAQLAIGGRTTYLRCRFDGAGLRDAYLGQARFEHCSFENARIEQWFSMAAEFIGCTFSGRISGSRFFGRPFGPEANALRPEREINEFHDNDFARADLWGVVFEDGIDIDAQRLPASPEYVRLDRFPERFRAVRRAVAAWSDLDRRSQMLRYLSVFEGYLGDAALGTVDQDKIFERRHQGILSRDLEDAAWQLFRDSL